LEKNTFCNDLKTCFFHLWAWWVIRDLPFIPSAVPKNQASNTENVWKWILHFPYPRDGGFL
jgi:hypothetical protein